MSTPADKPDLSLTSTDDLIAELKRRCDGFIFGMERDITATNDGTMFEYWGGASRCIGMCERLKAMAMGDVHREDFERT